MGSRLAFRYDREADILYIQTRPPYAEQESEEIGDDVVARLNPLTGDIENLEVLFFSSRLQDEQSIDLPIEADFRLADALG